MISHLDDGTLHELVDGEIPSHELAPIRDHLASCVECRARLETARLLTGETDDLIEALDVPVRVPALPDAVIASPAAGSREWIRHAAWAASLVLAVGAGYFARGARPAVGVPITTPTADAVVTARQQTPPGVTDAGTERTALATPHPRAMTGSREAALADTGSGKVNAPVANHAVPAPSTVAEAQPPRDSATALPTDQVGSVLALQPGVMASPIGAAATGISPTAEAPFQIRLRSESAARDRATNKSDVADTISFVDAVRRLGGRLLLIEGLVPVRLEAVGRAVRVVYRVHGGELVLQQSFVNGAPIVTLIAPAGFPADSLDVLRGRIHE